MDGGRYDREVSMLCPTCGSDQFSYDDEADEADVTCANCGKTMTREELIRENSENIDLQLVDTGEQITRDVAKELNQSLKKAFRGNKNIRFK